MKVITTLVLGISILVVIQGCAPAFCPLIPKINGEVVDKESRVQVADAHVVLKIEGQETVEVSSDKHGRFRIKGKSTLTLVPLFLPWDFVPPHGDLIVSAEGYKDSTNEAYGHAFDIKVEMEPNSTN